MKKGIVAILAVAIIGALGIYTKDHKSNSTATAPPSNSTSTLSNNTSSSSEAVNSTGADTPASATGGYKDGSYNGAAEDTPYGPVQVAVVISGGQITDVKFLEMPSDEGHSREVTSFSEPLLKQITLQKQSAHIDFVSGATDTSQAYQQSLQRALDQAALS